MSVEFFFYFVYYKLILISVLGYGFLIEKTIIRSSIKNLGMHGLVGLFFLILYSYFSHFFYPHGMAHNVILLFLGTVFFIKYFKFTKQYRLILSVTFLILFIGLIIFKTHDDFPYYHFPYSYYLTQNPLFIGIGQFNHGFRTPSSLFYLNSLFYLPIIKYYTFYIPTVLIMGFSNLFLLDKILFYRDQKKDHIFYLSLIFLIFFNIFFYRIQEHGTDRSAQILIAIFFIQLFSLIEFQKNYKKILSYLVILLGLIISLKAFYILYLIFAVPIIYIFYIEKKLFLIRYIFKLPSTYFFILLILFVVVTYFFNTGCLLYPVSITCFENTLWSIGSLDTKQMSIHYELWSKAGKTPNFTTNDPELYLQNLNWFSNWINLYFFNKVLDFILGLLFLCLVVLLFFKKNNFRKFYKNNNLRNIKIIYLFIVLLFIEWFFNHPSLRYGGYILIALISFIPLSYYLQNYDNDIKDSKKKVIILICITILLFIGRNAKRINNEIIKYDYNPLLSPRFYIDERHFRIQKEFDSLIKNFKSCKIKLSDCDLKSFNKVKEFYIDRYIFVR